ncbi:hypothetical protein ACKWTF_000858 [Chironomus riparius]
MKSVLLTLFLILLSAKSVFPGIISKSSSVCSTYLNAYYSLNSQLRDEIHNFIQNSNQINFKILCEKTKEFIGNIMTESTISSDDRAILTIFYDENIIQKIPSVVCLLIYELNGIITSN